MSLASLGGDGAAALRGKRCQWLVTTGGDPLAFSAGGMHGHELAAFVPPIEQTARFCGMHWQPPLVVHGAHRVSDRALAAAANEFRQRLESLAEAHQGKEMAHA